MLKVGDKVRVRKDIAVLPDLTDCGKLSDCVKQAGNILTVLKPQGQESWVSNANSQLSDGLWYAPNWIEPAKKYKVIL